MKGDDLAHAVLDASALLAYLQGEPGGSAVRESMASGAVISAANYAEVLSKLVDAGEPAEAAHRRLGRQGLSGGLLDVVPLVEEDAVAIARLRATTRADGLSLGDRACVALGLRLGLPIVTADRAWGDLALGAPIRLLRP